MPAGDPAQVLEKTSLFSLKRLQVAFVTPVHSTYLSRKTNQVSSVTKKTRGSRPNSHLSAHFSFFFSKVSTHHPLSHSVIYVFVLSCTHMFIRSCVETALLGRVGGVTCQSHNSCYATGSSDHSSIQSLPFTASTGPAGHSFPALTSIY